MPYRQVGTGRLRRLDYPGSSRGRRRDRALDQHVLARAERLERHLLVRVVRRAKDDGVEVVACKRLFRLDHFGNVEAVRNRVRLRGVGIGQRHELDVLPLRENRHVHDLTDRPRPDHRQADRRSVVRH